MKNITKYSSIIILFLMFFLVSCNDFLDTLPDKRTELDTPEKIGQLLVSAYPTELPTMVFEFLSDNVTDNGPNYGFIYEEQTITQAYEYKDITNVEWDVPQASWQSVYKAIATANQALEAIEGLPDPEVANGIKAEALLCRAYGHFTLANIFCIAYNPETSSTDLGIPYATKPETTVKPQYERGTVAEVYELIDKDIEDALPLLEDNYEQPAFHFNNRAAYAFAAQFNLFYGKWEKAVQYSTQAIGEDPTAQFRDMEAWSKLVVLDDRMYAYVDKDARCNLLILPQRSLWGRIFNLRAEYARYAHNMSKLNQTTRQYFPWGNLAPGYSSAWGSAQNTYIPKCNEIFETINATARTGQPHTVMVPFTVEETLTFRAEANAMLKRYDDAARDLSYWYAYYSKKGYTFSAEQISNYYSISRTNAERIKMDSRFGIEPGMQDNLVRAALALRRLETVHTGRRWLDIRRHGITVEHPLYSTNTEYDVLVMKPYDSRTAIQIPQDVVLGGIQENPRNDIKASDPSLVEDSMISFK